MDFFKRFSFILLFCITPCHLLAQNLDTLMANGKSLLEAKENEQAEMIYKEALLIAEDQKEIEKQGVIYNNLAIIYKRQADYIRSIKTYNKSLAKYYEMGNDSLIVGVEVNIGNALNKMGSYEFALTHFSNALGILKKLENRSLEANICNALGIVNYHLKQYDIAADYYRQSLQIYTDFNDEAGISKVMHNRAELYLETNDLNGAEESLKIEKLIKTKLEKPLESNTTLFGELHLKKENWDSAFYCFNSVLKTRLIESNVSRLTSSYLYLANYYEATNDSEKYEAYLDSAFFWADSLEQNNLALEVLQLQIGLELEKLKESEIKWKYGRWNELNDSLNSERVHLTNVTSLNNYEIFKKNKEIGLRQTKMELQDAENKNLNFKYQLALIGLMIFLVLVMVIFFLTIRMRKKNEILHSKNETIQSLHSELNHRTKNYYQMFGGMLYDDLENEENENTKEVLRHYLSRVNAMSQIQHHLVYAEKQTQQKIQLNVYLGQLIDEIDLALNHKEFSVSIERNMKEVTLDYHRALHVGLALNELFQNAFKHGFHGIKNPIIQVDLFEEKESYNLIIEDNGIGIDTEFSDKKRSKGMGLISDLMKKIHGNLNHKSGEKNGVIAKLIFPK